MRILKPLLCSFALVLSAFAAEKPVQLDPMEVRERPFGELGINATCRTTWLALVSNEAKIQDMVVTEVVRKSVAEKSGLKPRDRVTAIDGIAVSELSVHDVIQIWREKGVGDHVRLEIWRASTNETKIVEVPVEKKKTPAVAAASRSATDKDENQGKLFSP